MGILRTDKISGLETPTAVTGSVVFDGDGDYLNAGSVGNWNFLHNGLTDWTVEFWARSGTATAQFSWGTAGSSSHTGFHFQIMSLSDGQGNGQGLYAQASRGSAGNYRYWGANNCLSLNTWHHIAAVFKSSSKTLTLYVDGREVDNDTGTANGTFATTDYSSSDSTYALRIGENPGGTEDYNGYISNLRVISGTALYTSNFTPPTHELEVIGDTVLLCCNNPDSAAAASYAGIGTSKTITVNGNAAASTFSPGLTRDFTFGTQFEGVSRFDTQGYFVPPSGTTEQRGRGRGLFAGGDPGINTINYINIASMGNAQDFGDLSQTRLGPGSVASSTRAVFMGGYSGANVDTMDYVTIASTGNALDFGNLGDDDRHEPASVSNQTRGMVGGGQGNSAISDRIDYITIASTGDSIDFGNLTVARRNATGVMSSTRGVFCGGRNNTPAPSTQQEELDYVTISSTGNAIDFGDLTVARGRMGSVCSSIRGVVGGGEGSPADSNVIDYITIASTGNAQDFGDMITASDGANGGCSNSMRGVFGGHNIPGGINTMEYVTISSTGNSQDFGDLLNTAQRKTGCSDSHGGIS